jgi:Ca-activated chloride channel homolog
MKGYLFSEYKPERDKRTDFERLLDVFLEILTHTSGDVEEAIDWLRQIDREHQLTNDNYSIDDFINELKEKGFLKDGSENGKGIPILSSKGEQAIRQRALDQVFGKMKRGGLGQHQTNKLGQGDEQTEDRRPFQFGDKLEQIDFSESFRNAQINHG